MLEDTVIQLARWLRDETGSPNLCLAGGVALNCVMNSRLRDAAIFDHIWVQPAAGDAGTALGAAMWVDAHENGRRGERMAHAYLGPSFTESELEQFLRYAGLTFSRPGNLPEDIAKDLAEDRVVGWFQGRMEFGPRALGSRSILASPISDDMQARLNQIKDREDFRPVAPAVLSEAAGDWFDPPVESPYMLFTFDVKGEKGARIPAVQHIDRSARIQTVDRSQNPLYYDLISAFERRTGVPILVNTSFNTRGKPIVCTPRDAVECFMTSPIDVLALGPFVLRK